MERPFITIKTSRLIVRVPLDEILYVQRKCRKLQVETAGITYLYYEELKNVIPVLDGRFSQVLTGVIVNMDRISWVSNGLVRFDCGKEYQFARESGNRVRKQFFLYLKEHEQPGNPLFMEKTVAQTGAAP